MMDPFDESDDASEQSLTRQGPRPLTHARSPPSTSSSNARPPTAARPILQNDADDVEDPFEIQRADSPLLRGERPPSRASRGASVTEADDEGSVGSPSGIFAAGVSQRPRDVTHTSASQMLSSNTGAGPSRYRDEPSSGSQGAVKLASIGSAKAAKTERPTDADERDLSSEEESSRLLATVEQGDHARPASSLSSRTSKSNASRRSDKRKAAGSESLATLKALGRRIVRSARQNEEEDASSHRARDRDNGPIRLESVPGEEGSSEMLKGRAWRRLSERERALWMWANVEDLDDFLRELYTYYTGKGLVCIVLTRSLNLLTIAFVIGFSTSLFGCVDYSSIRHDGQLREVIIEGCVSRFSTLTILSLIIFGVVYSLQVVRFVLSLSRLGTMHHFFQHLLDIPEADIQTIPWHQVVARLSSLLATHPIASLPAGEGEAAQKIDVHEAANRLMRQDNYLIALLNRDLLDLGLPLPAMFGAGSSPPILTKSLLWNLNFCLLGFLIDQDGNVRRQFLSDRHRTELIAGLKRRLIFMAAVNAIFAPFIIMYIMLYSFFRYFEEYHKNPASLGSRQYTELARWKFREFNELPHLFRKRCHASYPYAQRYVEQFPKERNAILARFVSFVAGSFAAVLVLAAVIDPDLFLHFEITPQRNTLFYIGIFGAVLAGARAMIPDERAVFEPEVLLEGVIFYTHYCPEDWKGRFHSAEVNAEFGKLYSLKVGIFVIEVLSVLVTPLVLCFSLPKNAPAIIDFFRESTVHVEGLGYVCSFAVFDFARYGKTNSPDEARGAPEGTGLPHRDSRESKMEQSALHFAAANDWQPDPASSLYLSRLQTQYWQANQRGASIPAQTGQQNVPSNAKAILAGFSSSTTESMLAHRSQMYEDAFERSMSRGERTGKLDISPRLSKPSTGAKMSSHKNNPRRGLQVVREGNDDSSVLSSVGDFADPVADMREEQERRRQKADGALPRSLRQHLDSVL